jgi:3-oxoacyl-[acyl-carrier-protein] synthase II
MRRVVVTGLGIVAPCGNCVADAWAAALAGRSAVRRISAFDPSQLPVQIAAEVRDFDPLVCMDAKEARQSSRFVQFAAAAAHEAARDSGLEIGSEADRCGCAMGVGLGSLGDIEEQAKVLEHRGPRRVSPLLIPYAIPNMAAGYVSLALGLAGPNLGVTTACASGAHALGEAYMHIAIGTADVMFAGGAEAATTPLLVAGFARMRALSERNDAPQEASRPFDRDRDGFVMGEGAGVLVLEEYEHARRRGARMYAELAGYGASADAFHITSPHPEGRGAASAIAAALRSGRISLEEVDYINAHGTSTAINDAAESAAIETVFGEAARRISISSTKGVTGHCLGAAGAIEAAFTALAVRDGVAPPTANYSTPDPACRLDYTPRAARTRSIRCALSNSFGFGGQNACLAFRQIGAA